MRLTSLRGVSALASVLINADLLGQGAIKYGAPDKIILNSGGPATDLAKNSILCGPTNTRIVVKQPKSESLDKPNNALEGKINLISKKPNFTAEVEEWKHGCWYHRNIISAASLGDLMNKLKQLTPEINFLKGLHNHPTGPFWAGAIAYDMVQWTQPILLEKTPATGDVVAVFWLIENFIIHNIASDKYTVYGLNELWNDAVLSIITEQNIEVNLPKQVTNNFPESSSISDEQHLHSINKITTAIAKGMFYQVNFGRFWSGRLVEHPLTIFQRLNLANPAPFSAYIEAEDLGLAIVSSSPETLLQCFDGNLSTAPIKGTVTRGANEFEDLAMINSIIDDVKERSEHRMLVDLMRNDLSAVCEVGTVNLSRFNVESYTNVHHLVSHISGTLSNNLSSSDALSAIFPGGSITGCPRTMVCAAIDQIEPANRSFWTGSVGWFSPHSNDCSWNILIRTLEARKQGKKWTGIVGAGGGITIRSDPVMEVSEAIWKSQAIRKACGWLEPDFDLTNSGKLEVTKLPIETQFNFSNCGIVSNISDLESDGSIKNSVVIIDNLDSFTLNIAHAIAGLGYDVCIVNGRDSQSEHYVDSGVIEAIFAKNPPSHVILGPGPGVPQDSKITMQMAQFAMEGRLKIPLLGICLGHQAIGIVDGYDLIRDPNGAIHGTPVNCRNDGSGLFATVRRSNSFVRYNSLIITGDGSNQLVPNAFDEHDSIMGLRHKSLPIHTLQYHPESIGSTNGIEIIKSFLDLSSDG